MLLSPFCDFDWTDPSAASTMATGHATAVQSTSPQQSAPRDPAPQVFAIPELVINILIHLEPAQIMSSQRVSSIFRDVVKNKHEVQEAAFLRPVISHPVLQISMLDGAVDGLTAYKWRPAHWAGLPLRTFGDRRTNGINTTASNTTLRAKLHLVNPSILEICSIQNGVHPSDCRMCGIFNNMPLLAQRQMARITLDGINRNKVTRHSSDFLDMHVAQPPAEQTTLHFAKPGSDEILQTWIFNEERGVRVRDLLDPSWYTPRGSAQGCWIYPRFLSLTGGYFATPEVQNAVLAAGSRGMSCSVKMHDQIREDERMYEAQFDGMFRDSHDAWCEYQARLYRELEADKKAFAEGRLKDFDPEEADELFRSNFEQEMVALDDKLAAMHAEQDEYIKKLHQLAKVEENRMLRGFLPEHEEDYENEEGSMEFQEEGDLMAFPTERRTPGSYWSMGFSGITN